jgi:hypothetical protein
MCVSQTIIVLHRTKQERERKREREGEREVSEGVFADSTVHPLIIYANIADFSSRPPQKQKRTSSSERAFLRQLMCSTKRNERERERE